MSKTKTLFPNPWLSLMQIEDPDQGVSGYVYAHETRCDGKVVLVLPFRSKDENQFGGIEVLFRREVTPAWDMSPTLSGITGGVEDEDPAEDALRELEEEAGYTVSREDLIFLGTTYASKAMDTVYHLYAANVEGKSQQMASGDGSRLESEGSVEWHDNAMGVEDAVASCAYFRLMWAMLHWRQGK
jgi:8-oxo-dGTP pyrophosphatase MutT (NUDIX family)